MKIVKIKGGLGNQLFQYAFALYLQSMVNEEVKLDFLSCYGTKDLTCTDRIKMFNLSLPVASNEEIKKSCKFFNKYPLLSLRYRVTTLFAKTFDKKNYFFEVSRHFLDIKQMLNYKYYDGYWQSYLYSDAIKDALKRDLTPKDDLSDKTKQMINKISSENSVFIGIRKGDYAAGKSNLARFGSFSVDYYLNAIKKMKELVKDPVFYVFSNDIEWCKQNIDWGDSSVIYRERDAQVSDFEELVIMSKFKHAIILNSTFHWWGAYLIDNKDKIVIAPSEWFNDGTKVDIIPPTWIQMKRNGEFVK